MIKFLQKWAKVKEKIKVYVYNPTVKTGGTNNLLGNLALLLADDSKYSVYYIDYENSPIRRIIVNAN